jgi:hypothetical protein
VEILFLIKKKKIIAAWVIKAIKIIFWVSFLPNFSLTISVIEYRKNKCACLVSLPSCLAHSSFNGMELSET